MVQALPHIQATPPATVINRLARTVVGLVTDVTLALSVTPGAPATGLTRVGVDVEAPGRSAELWRAEDRCRRLHLGPWGPPQRAARLRRALAPPSVYPLTCTKGETSGAAPARPETSRPVARPLRPLNRSELEILTLSASARGQGGER